MLPKPLNYPTQLTTGRIENCLEAFITRQTASYLYVQHIYFNLFLVQTNTKTRNHAEKETGIILNDFQVHNKPI